MQQNIFIPCAQKSTQLAVCNLFRLKFVHKILILGGLEEQLELSTHRCTEQIYIQHHSNFWVYSDVW